MTDKVAFTIVELNKFRKKTNQLENTQDYWSYLLRKSTNWQNRPKKGLWAKISRISALPNLP